MRLYLAGILSAGFDYANECEYILESYHYIQKMAKSTDYLREAKRTIFLDSGAFSMFTQGIEVNLEAYADYIKKNQDVIHIASNLDEIGQNKEKQSYDNQKILEGFGVDIKPVHHARDDDKWLLKYMAEGYDYIFLGGMVPESTKYLIGWLDHIWDKYLTNKDGSAKIKVHGFGLTTLDLMKRYPWYSVDSTTWVMTSRFGSIYMDLPGKDIRVTISDQSPKVHDLGGHYDTLDDLTKRLVENRIRELGYDFVTLRTDYRQRDRFNMGFFGCFMDREQSTFRRRDVTLF